MVSANGWITSVTDQNGFTTNYGYDAMGRLASVAYPTGDSTAWNSTTQAFVQVNGVEYGIPAGHWRQTVSTGNARKVTYYDGLWRPLLTHEYDASSVAATQRFQRFSYGYDANGAVNFVSYPGATDALSTGHWTSYDALGRVRGQAQSSELGTLTTSTEYLSGFRTRVTDPRGQQTITSYQAWDQPIRDFPVAIAQPGGVYTDIARDVFGKPTAITQRNAASTQTVTRRYVYDTYQQLCKTIEPETGSTVMAYDNVGNLTWSASGLALPSASSCDTASVSGSQKISRSYDARNRLVTLAFPDGNGNQTWNYTLDGLPFNVTTSNNAGSSTVTNSYTYNRRRLLTGEGQTQTDGYTWSIGYGYNSNGHLTSLVHPSTLTVNYTPNALGQPTQAGIYASNVQYHPNGAMKQFTYGNGVVRTVAQNARQLTSRITDSGGVLDQSYSYDANGNVGSITDHTAAGRQTRSMSYDGRDRLLTVTSPLYPGGATYAYDALDNLTRVTVAGRDHRYLYDASNRLTNVTDGAGGPSVIGLGYDVRGNVNNKNGQLYSFDHGNRLRGALGTESYRYDAHGRRVRTLTNSSTALYEMYSQSGQLLWQRDELVGNRYDYIYLNGTVVAVRSRRIGSEVHDPIYWHTDALGSQIAATVGSAVVQTTEHEPYGRMLNREPHNRVAYTGHVMDMATKLSYMQQRYYDPQLGMFLSVDPVTAFSNPIATFNRYRYAYSNPYRFIDPDGRAGCAASRLASICQSFGMVGGIRTTNNPGNGFGRGYAGRYGDSPSPKGKQPGPWKEDYVYPKKAPQIYVPSEYRSRNGTLQLGLHGSIAALGAVDVGFGVAISDVDMGLYSSSSLGFGPRDDANISFVVTWSDAPSIEKLRGSSISGTLGGGVIGHGSINAAISESVPGQPVYRSGGFGLGLGAGGGGSAGFTETSIYVVDRHEK